MIYLDNAATTYPKPDIVLNAIDKANRNAFNSGRGSYKSSRESSKVIDDTRNKIAQLSGNKSANVIFTPSATVALNDIIFGIDINDGDNIYITPFEHNSIVRPLEELKKKKNINIIHIPFNNENWELEIEKLNNLFVLNKPKMVLVSQVSNVTGYLIDYNEIFELSSKYDAITVLDASQGFGVVPINNSNMISYIVFAGHKSLYASFGIAGYIKNNNDKLKHNIFGGTGSDTMNPNMSDSYPIGYEAGSHNIVAISGLSASIGWLKTVNVYEHETELTKYLISKLKELKNITIYVPKNIDKIFGVVSINLKGYNADEVGNILDDEFDICVRTGYHCAPLVHDFIQSIDHLGTVRISLCYFNTKEDIDALIEALKSI